MANVDRKLVAPTLIAVAILASAGLYDRVPPRLELRLDGILPFDVAAPPDIVARAIALFFLPALALVLWAAFRAVRTTAGERIGRRLFRHAPDVVASPGQFDRFGNTYESIVLGVVLLLLGLHAAVVAAALGYPALATRIVPLALGGSLVLMGNVVPRLRPNWVAGIRTGRTLRDPQLWRSTHRAFGAAFVAGGLVTILVGVWAPRFGLVTGLVAVLAACGVGFLASRQQPVPGSLT